MRQLDQRVSAHCRLQALDLAGTAGYISHRLQRAGGSVDRISFSGDAVEAIYERSAGVPRVINKLCDRALQSGYARRVAVIDRQMIEGTEPAAKSSSPSSALPSAKVPHPMATALKQAVPATAERRDPLDDWLNSIEDEFVDEANPSPQRARFVPLAHARLTPSRVPRKWTRRLEALAFGLVLLLVALMLGPWLYLHF
jgi:hypothetical protein